MLEIESYVRQMNGIPTIGAESATSPTSSPTTAPPTAAAGNQQAASTSSHHAFAVGGAAAVAVGAFTVGGMYVRFNHQEDPSYSKV